MEWTVIIGELFKVVLIPLLGLLVKYFSQFVHIKAEEIKQKNDDATFQKYITMLDNTIVNAVTATTQTYVESLKAQGKFDAEAQKTAFDMSYKAIMAVLGDEAKSYLSTAVGDLNKYITDAIERQVNINKNTATTQNS